ncbi:MAG: ribbon-helix-helix domain-containing protein [Patescibacteria group bacterium]
MTTTINISLPKEMYKDAKKIVAERRYTSISELIRDALRKIVYQEEEITENGFPRWFENRVLESEKEPEENDTVIETDEDLRKYFREMRKRVAARRHGKA